MNDDSSLQSIENEQEPEIGKLFLALFTNSKDNTKQTNKTLICIKTLQLDTDS
jgi:hypothetical protein